MRHQIIAIHPALPLSESDPAVFVTARFVVEAPGKIAQHSPDFTFVVTGSAEVAEAYRAADRQA